MVFAGGIVGIALGIICILFFIQQLGTRFVGVAFSPIILVWLICNAMIGIYNLQQYGAGVFRAFGPNYWFDYLMRNGKQGWKTLGGVVLCITGQPDCYGTILELPCLVLPRPPLPLSSKAKG